MVAAFFFLILIPLFAFHLIRCCQRCHDGILDEKCILDSKLDDCEEARYSKTETCSHEYCYVTVRTSIKSSIPKSTIAAINQKIY